MHTRMAVRSGASRTHALAYGTPISGTNSRLDRPVKLLYKQLKANQTTTPGNCDPNDISPYLPEAEARFINSGLYDLTLRMKNGASSGLQRNETPLQSTAFVTDTHSLQGHGEYGDHHYNGGFGLESRAKYWIPNNDDHGGYNQPYFQEGGYDSHGAYHVQASQSQHTIQIQH